MTSGAVAKILPRSSLPFEKLARTEEAGSLSELEAVAKAAEHLGYSLAHAFRGGIVTSLPPETKEVWQPLAARLLELSRVPSS